MTYLASVEYCGKNYCGWQRQVGQLSVQEVMENACEGLFGVKTAVTASGRTDAGVHALCQAVSFFADTSVPTENLHLALNARLPDDIRVRACHEVSDDFNARFSAKRKTYLYKAYISEIGSAIRKDFYAQIVPPFDYRKAKKACEGLVGTHDFLAFSATGSDVKDTVRTIYEATVEVNADEVYITVSGNGFLYNMVRIIAGTLIEIGKGRLPVDTVEKMIKTKDRSLGGKTYPACGLYLASVEYGN